MLRITELRLPLDHAPEALRPAIVARLGMNDADLQAFTVFKRAYDARKKTAIVLIYTVDCELRDEAAVFAALLGDEHHGRADQQPRHRALELEAIAGARAEPAGVLQPIDKAEYGHDGRQHKGADNDEGSTGFHF